MKKLKIFFIALFLCSVTCFADTGDVMASSHNSTVTTQNSEEESRTSFFLHAGFIDLGLGMKVRLSKENGVYATLGLMWQAFHIQYIRIPLLFHFGGNHIHFIVGATLLNAVSSGDTNGEAGLGINWDFNKHWGLNLMMFTPVSFPSSNGASLLLDVRYVF